MSTSHHFTTSYINQTDRQVSKMNSQSRFGPGTPEEEDGSEDARGPVTGGLGQELVSQNGYLDPWQRLLK